MKRTLALLCSVLLLVSMTSVAAFGLLGSEEIILPESTMTQQEESTEAQATTRLVETTREEGSTSVSLLLGDVDGNGKVSPADARLALRAAAKLVSLSKTQFTAADVDKNGRLSPSDARKILRVAAKLEQFS